MTWWQPARWGKVTRSPLARNTLWVILGQVLRVGVQAAYFVLIARALGAREYGAYVGVVAVVAIAAPFASLGTGNLLIKHVARTPEVFGVQWGRALATTVLSGTGLLIVVLIVARLWLPPSIPLALVLAVGTADLLLVRLIDVSAQAYQAFQRLSRTAVLQLLLSPLRLVAAVVLISFTDSPTALQWGFLYLAASVFGGIGAVVLTTRELGRPRLGSGHLGTEMREGVYFSVSLSAQSAINDIDKAMLARLATLEATGIYSAAFRIVDVAFLPVSALLMAAYARFFQRGLYGIRAAAGYGRRLLGVGGAYGLLASAALFLAAPLIPTLLGDEYVPAVDAMRWLALLPTLKALHYFGADALTGAGYQGARTLIQVTVAGANVLLNLWLIPLYSWKGAAIATLVSDALLGVGIWAAVWVLATRASRAEASPGAGRGGRPEKQGAPGA